MAMCLNATVMAHIMVECRGADGESRVEWGCDRDTEGHCAKACAAETTDDSSHHDQPEPCEDIPVNAKVSPAANGRHHQDSKLPELPIAILHFVDVRLSQAVKGGVMGVRVQPKSPPRSLRVVQSIVFLV